MTLPFFLLFNKRNILKSNLHYTRGITPQRVTSGGAHLRDLTLGQHRCEETSQQWRAVGDNVSDLTGQEIEPRISRSDGNLLNNCTNRPVVIFYEILENYTILLREIWKII